MALWTWFLHWSKRHLLQFRYINDCSNVPAITGTVIAHRSPKQNQLLCEALVLTQKQAQILLWRGCSLISPSGSLFLGTHGWIQWQLGKDGDGKDLGYKTFIPCSDINSVTSPLPLVNQGWLLAHRSGVKKKSIHICQELWDP